MESIDELRIIGELGPVCEGRWVGFCRVSGPVAHDSSPLGVLLRRNWTFGGLSGSNFVRIILNSAGGWFGMGKPRAARVSPGHLLGAGWHRLTVGLRFFGGTSSIERFEV